MSFDSRFLKPDGSFYNMVSGVTGEATVWSNGRKIIVDGMVKTPQATFYLEYLGCRYHTCHLCNTPCVKDSVQMDKEKLQALENIGHLITIRGCQWKRLRSRVKKRSPYSMFFYSSRISSTMILDSVRNGQFFGLLEVDIKTPPKIKMEFERINFATIFNKISPTKEMIGEKMLEVMKHYGSKFPIKPQLTLVYNAEHYLLTSEMLRYYLDLGMEVVNIHYCIEYQRSQPLRKFIELSNNVPIFSNL